MTRPRATRWHSGCWVAYPIPIPSLRDGIAYEALTAWLRGNGLEADTRLRLRDDLYAMLQAPDAEGFARPFAALVLSEVARTDRITPWMTPAERVAMVDHAVAYLSSVRTIAVSTMRRVGAMAWRTAATG